MSFFGCYGAINVGRAVNATIFIIVPTALQVYYIYHSYALNRVTNTPPGDQQTLLFLLMRFRHTLQGFGRQGGSGC